MQEEKKNIKDMTLEEHLEYNRLFIRKLRETPEYRQQEKEYKEQNKEKLNARAAESEGRRIKNDEKCHIHGICTTYIRAVLQIFCHLRRLIYFFLLK